MECVLCVFTSFLPFLFPVNVFFLHFFNCLNKKRVLMMAQRNTFRDRILSKGH